MTKGRGKNGRDGRQRGREGERDNALAVGDRRPWSLPIPMYIFFGKFTENVVLNL